MDISPTAAAEPPDAPDEWQLRLNRYQRDNLLHLLRTCGYPSGNPDALPPFTLANTGDWLSEIHDMLAQGSAPSPNLPIAEAVAAASAQKPACSNCKIMSAAQQKLGRQVIIQREKLDRIMMCLGNLSGMFDESDTIDWRESGRKLTETGKRGR